MLALSAACVVWLTGCDTLKTYEVAGPDPVATGTVAADGPTAAPGVLGGEPGDNLNLGKKQFRAGNYGLAEEHFRRAVETHPNDAEAWLGLAAAYDRLRRFDLADRAYAEAIKIAGPSAAILNNQGFSYMLRGDYRHAREKLLLAQAANPKDPHATANLRLLDEAYRKGKAVE
jgi:Flp pilus assembly protein TadD